MGEQLCTKSRNTMPSTATRWKMSWSTTPVSMAVTIAGNDLHKAVLLQPLQNAADRSAGNAEPLAQLVFAQRFPGQDLQCADLVLENMIELISVL